MSQTRVTVEIVEEPIQLGRYEDDLANPDVGAHAWFLGVTRRTTEGKITETLYYQAYQEMAMRQMQKIAIEAAQQFSLSAVVLVHRLGEVSVGEVSVLVGVCSGHRPEAFAALPWIMDRLKEDVPIWKQECDDRGKRHWVHSGEPRQGSILPNEDA
jgi:molybdopterin synthase catalytic subunit